MTPVELSRTVLGAVRRAVDDGVLDVAVPERVKVTPPGPGGCGDYATNVALQLARPAGQPPLKVAEILRTRLAASDGVRDVVVTGPGFLNISLGDSAGVDLVARILRRGPRYGFVERATGEVAHLHAPRDVRAVVVMDVVGRLLRSQGVDVRTSCEGGVPAGEWVTVLGVPDGGMGGGMGHGMGEGAPRGGAFSGVHVIQPVPAPASPLHLGRDAGRWALLHPAAHDRPRISDEHLVQREGNPLFRVRYAHARIRAVSRNAADLGFRAEPGTVGASAVESGGGSAQPGGTLPPPTGTPGARPHDKPGAATPQHHDEPGTTPPAATPHPLLHPLADHPRVLAQAAAHRAPDRLARHLVSVADAVLPLLPAVLPRGAEKPSATHRARLALAEAAGAVLAGGLSLLGIDAPEHL
ncbi:ArgS-related anticodon-binding protein NrtL [Streptomyces sp. KAU_LT]|uniref:ArgS-related anticodon-binding protein NrtL n=1 Tax=Streptomyces sp. KAU_LT TaxID=3046669 RepID=UPI0024B6E94C|nr:arginine--tRNA ligase [Streptomyces sp. KAU_LT]MDI9831182.1 DALR anticodon-binding domain-containing protein [Streptomyces sp. KAU_LT]